MSLVRSNTEGEVGFLSEKRRLNGEFVILLLAFDKMETGEKMRLMTPANSRDDEAETLTSRCGGLGDGSQVCSFLLPSFCSFFLSFLPSRTLFPLTTP